MVDFQGHYRQKQPDHSILSSEVQYISRYLQTLLQTLLPPVISPSQQSASPVICSHHNISQTITLYYTIMSGQAAMAWGQGHTPYRLALLGEGKFFLEWEILQKLVFPEWIHGIPQAWGKRCRFKIILYLPISKPI